MKQKYILSTNKLLFELFNYHFEDTDIKTEKVYQEGKLIERYYQDFIYESSNSSSFRVRISSIDKENLNFTIYERMLYLILISNARQTDAEDNSYFITMRKIRSIRCLKEGSLSTYKCYELALNRLTSKSIRILPYKTNAQYKVKLINCNLLTVTNQVAYGGRISEFNYSFGGLTTSFINNSQRFITYYNPFNFIFKKYFSFQLSLHIIRLIALNQNKFNNMEFSYKRMLKQIFKVNINGVIDKQNYYDYLASSENKQSTRLSRSYEELEIILKQFVKNKMIQSFNISERRTFKYLRDDEVKILIKFIK